MVNVNNKKFKDIPLKLYDPKWGSKLANTIIELPMWGINKSLNVMVSLGIVLYEITKQYDH